MTVDYHYLGLATPVVVDFPNIDVQLDRTADGDGNRQFSTYSDHSGTYPAFDRFGRLVRHLWVDGGYGSQGGAIPAIVHHERSFDKVGNLQTRQDKNEIYDQDWTEEEFDHDELLRLLKA